MPTTPEGVYAEGRPVVRPLMRLPDTTRQADCTPYLYAIAALLGPASGTMLVPRKPTSRHQSLNCAPV